MSQENIKEIRIQAKVDSIAGWQNYNPVLLDREIGYERETGKYKIGNGVSAWNDLKYAGTEAAESALIADYATSAGSAEQASMADNATHANTADVAKTAENAGVGKTTTIYDGEIFNNNNNVAGFDRWFVLDSYEDNGHGYTLILKQSYGQEAPIPSFETGYKRGDEIIIFNQKEFGTIGEVTEVSGNIITTSYFNFNNNMTDNPQTSLRAVINLTNPELGIYFCDENNPEHYIVPDLLGAQHAEGQNTIALGNVSHAEGRVTHAYGDYSHTEGLSTYAKGEASHAEGGGTYAYGNASHAEGWATRAKGKYSHAEGYYAYAYGNASHAEGEGTKANSDYQHVSGKYNIEDENDIYACIIGNGEINAEGKIIRSNAHTLDWEGNAWFAGDITVGKNNDKLITETVMNNKLNDFTNIAKIETGSYVGTGDSNVTLNFKGIPYLVFLQGSYLQPIFKRGFGACTVLYKDFQETIRSDWSEDSNTLSLHFPQDLIPVFNQAGITKTYTAITI